MNRENPEPSKEVEAAVRPVLANLARAAGMQSVYLTEVDWGAARQSIVFAHNERGALITEGVSYPWSNALCRRALIDGPAYTVDAQRDWPDEPYTHELDLRTFVSIPVFTVDDPRQLLGTLCAVSSDVVALGPETRRMMRTAAQEMSRGLSRLRAEAPAVAVTATREQIQELGADLARAIAVIEHQRAELDRLAALATADREDSLEDVGISGAPTARA